MNRKNLYINAVALFTEKGPRNVTVDEIAGHAGISKKTIYQSFSNKQELVNAIYKSIISCTEKKLMGFYKTESGPVNEYISCCKTILSFNRYIHPLIVDDLKRFFSPAYKELKIFKGLLIPTLLSYKIEQGIQEGYYHNDCDSDLFAGITMHQLDYVSSLPTPMLHCYSKNEIKKKIVKQLLYSIATPKGKDIINHSIQTKNMCKTINNH